MCRTLNTRHKRTRNGVHACENSLRPTDSNEKEAKRSRGGIESVLRLTVPMLWLGLLPPRHLRFVNCLIISALFVNTFPTKAINSVPFLSSETTREAWDCMIAHGLDFIYFFFFNDLTRRVKAVLASLTWQCDHVELYLFLLHLGV